MINPEVIKTHIDGIYENLAILDSIKPMPFTKFEQDIKTLKLCEHCLQLSIQGLLDVCHYIIATTNLPRGPLTIKKRFSL